MNFIYLGSSRPANVTQALVEQGSYVNFAALTLQQALLEGFSKHLSGINIITSWRVDTFPKFKRLFFKKETYHEFGANKYVYVGGINLPFFNLISRFFRCRKELRRMLVKSDKNVLVIYEVHTPYLLAALSLKKHIHHVNLIVPDMPQFMSGNNNRVYLALKRIDSKLIKYSLKCVDSYSLLSEGMTELLPMEGKKWTLMEGIYQNSFKDIKVEKEPHKVIMYAGGLHRRRGVDLLVKAFKLIDNPDYRLWIRGDWDDDMKAEIITLSKTDHRVKYFDPMEREELLKMEQRATVMVYPTQPSLNFTKYFFPSKTMEYLASGTATVMFHLACMPKEYDDYLFYIGEESEESLKNKLVEVCEMPAEERSEFGQRAKRFVLTQKTPEKQCKKIIDLIIEDLLEK